MISQKKLEANRRNATKSTGPKTPEGKERSSQNGLTHGLTSKKCPILPGENEQEYWELQAALVRDLKPRGAMQREMVEDIVQTRWKIRRVPAMEAELMLREQANVAKQHDTDKWRKQVPKDSEPDLDPIKILATQFLYERGTEFDRLDLYRQRLERQLHTLLRELRKLREEMGDEENEPTERCITGFQAASEGTVQQEGPVGKIEPTESPNSLDSQEKDQSPISCPKPQPCGHLPAVMGDAKADSHEANNGDIELDGRYNPMPQGHPGVKPSACPVVLEDKESPL
jgi:hypothetical protein